MRYLPYTRFLLFSICALLASACGQKSSETTPPADGAAKKPVIALIMKSLANEFFSTMENGAREHQKAHADEYTLKAQGIKDESDVNRQVQLVEQMMADGVDAIIIAPADSKALAPVCRRAMEAGIKVVNIDNRFDVPTLAELKITIPFVGPDNRKGAEAVGMYVASKLPPGSPVIIIEGLPTAFNGQQRKLGFEDAMRNSGMNIVASQSAQWETATANKVVGALITEHPEVKAYLCANDSMALGAVTALSSAGRLTDTLVAGYDGISAAAELVQKGELAVTADQHPDKLAVYGVEYALEMLKTGKAPEDRETPVDLVVKPGA